MFGLQTIQKFAVASAAIAGVGVFWLSFTDVCKKTVKSIIKNQFPDNKENTIKKRYVEYLKNYKEELKVSDKWYSERENISSSDNLKKLRKLMMEKIKNRNLFIEEFLNKRGDIVTHYNELTQKNKDLLSLIRKISEEEEKEQEEDVNITQVLLRAGQQNDIQNERIALIVKNLQ